MTWAAVTSLQPEQVWVPGLDCRGLRELGYVAASELPMILQCLVLFPWHPRLQMQSNLPTATASPQHPKTGGRSALEELWKVTFFGHLLVVGFPLSASFLASLRQVMAAPLAKLRFGWWVKLKKEVVRYKPLGVSSSNLHTNLQPRNPTLIH